MAIDALLISIVLNTIIISPILWITVRSLVSTEQVKLSDAIRITLLGTGIGAIVGSFIGGVIAAALMFAIWLVLIKHFFYCGWLRALVIAILAVIFFIMISSILALVGIAIIATWL
jgi:hypothetical protein